MWKVFGIHFDWYIILVKLRSKTSIFPDQKIPKYPQMHSRILKLYLISASPFKKARSFFPNVLFIFLKRMNEWMNWIEKVGADAHTAIQFFDRILTSNPINNISNVWSGESLFSLVFWKDTLLHWQLSARILQYSMQTTMCIKQCDCLKHYMCMATSRCLFIFSNV
jgi:hypothetical protein